MKNITLVFITFLFATSGNTQSVGIDASFLAGAKFTVEQTSGTINKPEQVLWNRATNFTRLRFRNNSLGYWDLSARIGSLDNPSLDTFKITTDLEPNFFVMRGNGQIGINTPNPLFRLHIEGTNRPGVFARTFNASTDSGAIMGILDVPTGASFRASGVRGESKSTTTSSIGVYGLQNGGGWGVAGRAVEAGADDWGAGVFGEMIGGTGGSGVYGTNSNSGGYGGRFRDFSGLGFALYTQGRLRLTGINEAAGKVLTSDASGNANWQALPGGAGAWTVSGNDISNTNTGKVGIGTSTIDASSKMHILFSSGLSEFITLQSTVADKSMGFKLKNPDGQWTFGQNIGNYPDSRFNFFYTPAVGATSQLLTLTKEGNLGIGDYTGLGVAPTERLEIKNGFLKVSGTNRTAFTVTATATNTSGNNTLIDYINPANTDVIIVTHNWQGNYMGSIGVYFTAGTWRLFREDLAAIPVGEKFNVMIIK